MVDAELNEALQCKRKLSEDVAEINRLILGAGKMQRSETTDQAEKKPINSEINS